jgi:uncharacterized protein (TIGR02147 family)
MTIFELADYKSFLKQKMKLAKSLGRGGMSRLAEHLEVHPTLVSQVISGPKDFTEEQALVIAEYFGLGELEKDYFLTLVKIERAGTQHLKNHYRQSRDKMRQDSLQLSKRLDSKRTLSDEEKAQFYSSWLYSAVHVLTSIDDGADFNFICQRIKLPPAKVRKILDFLIRIQMVIEKNGKFSPGTTMTHVGRDSAFVVQHHTNWRVKSIEKIESLTEEELMYSLNVSLSRKDFKLLREELVQVIQSFLKVIKDSPAEDVAQFNLDFFWI